MTLKKSAGTSDNRSNMCQFRENALDELPIKRRGNRTYTWDACCLFLDIQEGVATECDQEETKILKRERERETLRERDSERERL